MNTFAILFTFKCKIFILNFIKTITSVMYETLWHTTFVHYKNKRKETKNLNGMEHENTNEHLNEFSVYICV